MRRDVLLPGLLLAALLAACSGVGSSTPPGGASPGPSGPAGSGSTGGKPSVLPVIVSSQQVVGPNRFVFSFIDAASNAPAASPDRTASVAFIAPGQGQAGTPSTGTFVWAIEGSRGVYVSNVDFPAAGAWKAVFTTQAPGGPSETLGVDFDVQQQGTTIAVGQQAPASKTPTAADVGGDLRQISSDKSPDPAFYQLSVSDAITEHRPFVLVFATPAFCQSAQCGPTLDRVKAVLKSAPPGVAAINVEPYKLAFTEGRLQPVLDASGNLQPVDAVNQWGLLSEPWIFTVDKDGIVRGSFEGVVGEDELKAAIAQIAGS